MPIAFASLRYKPDRLTKHPPGICPRVCFAATFAQAREPGKMEVIGLRTDDPLLAKQVLSQLSYTPSVISGQWSVIRRKNPITDHVT